MNHPAHRPGRKTADAVQAAPGQKGQPEQWEPMRYPPVTVMNLDQEEQYAASGYLAAGTPDPAAFSTAKASPFVAGRTVSEYPKMVNGVLIQDPDAPTSSFAEYPKWLTSPDGEQILVASVVEEEVILARWTAPAEIEPTKQKKSEQRAR